jgi:hypothetical protein
MDTKLQKDIRFLKLYCITITLMFAGFVIFFVTSSGTHATQQKTKFSEIDVERINIVEKDGKLKMIISNSERQHPGIIDGRMIPDRKRSAGLLFFNDKGDESGGLSFSGNSGADGKGSASGLLAFDRFNQDQTVAIQYGESGGRYYSGLRVWDRPDRSLGLVIDEMRKLEKMKDGPEKTAATQKMREQAAPGTAERAFFGRDRENASVVRLNDVNGKPRVKISVDASGAPKLEFLDETGKVTYSLPQAATPVKP